ncbi:MerR family transcriptional regulator [Niallia circulans]|uniref:MerR family transcriptional regulator n=1 Tax=Niallia circulans TaxID=1397 RepID=UPI00300A465B
MLISEASQTTNLTKKAIEYYIEQKLLIPNTLENGYRDFSEKDIECLKKIYVLRKLGLSTEEIRSVLVDRTSNTLQRISTQKELTLQREQEKKSLLNELGISKDYAEISTKLRMIEQHETVTEKILEAFPDYYGRFICLHFARFLKEPITTAVQESTYEEIIAFLDNVPPLQLAEDLQLFLMESTNNMNTESMQDMLANIKQSIEDPDQFLTVSKDFIERYLEYIKSEEYKNSPINKIQQIFKEFNNTSGYYDVFIPAMKKLSASYAAYCQQLESANEKLLLQYPALDSLKD